MMDERFEKTKHIMDFSLQKEAINQKRCEIFNAHQEDTRKRVDTLARTSFLLSGGALTLSIGIFLRKEARPIPPDLELILQSSWIALFYSIISFILVMGLMILGAYILGERWRKQLSGGKTDTKNWPTWTEILEWFLGATGLAAMFYGLGALVWVAIRMVGQPM